MTHNYVDVMHLSNDELLSRVHTLAQRERAATVELIAHLAEPDARELYLPAGYTSMFVYCRDALGLSEHEAYNRIEVARAARRHPVVLDLLADGVVSLTAVRLLAPHLTDDNHLALLESARGLRTAQVEELVASIAPRPDVPTTIRKLPITPTPPAQAAAPLGSSPAPPPSVVLSEPPCSSPGAPPRTIVEALAPERDRLQLTISGDTLEMLQLAKDLLRHALPSGDHAAILERALKALVAGLLKKKFAETDRPRPSRGTASGSRYVPAEAKRAVYLRDRGRCAFVGPGGGHRCHERASLEFHHRRPYAHGGPTTVENLELRCRRHNAYEWEREVVEVRRQEDDWFRQRYSSQDESVDGRYRKQATPPTKGGGLASP